MAIDTAWLRHLPESERAIFVSEINAAMEARDQRAVEQLLIAWRSTAEIYADPELLAKIANPQFEDSGPVNRP